MPHVFLSYVRENEQQADRIATDLQAAGASVWLDRYNITAGQRWQDAIRHAIQSGAYFLACFSNHYLNKERSNEELTLAIEELRKRPSNRAWFIPVLLSDCAVPDRSIGGGETLRDIQWANLSADWNSGIKHIINAIRPALRPTLLQSPWLGVRFRQGDQQVAMFDAGNDVVQVVLQPQPIEIRIPSAPQKGWAKICTSLDATIFTQIAHDMNRNDVPFFRIGTGMADTAYGSGGLWIEPEAHMHFDWGGRLLPHPDGGGVVLVNSIYRHRVELPTILRNRDIYAVIHVGLNDDAQLNNWTFERFILSF